MNRFLYCLMLLLLVFASCTKIELPEPKPTEAPFQLSFQVDGADLSMQAGANGYYLFTGFEAHPSGGLVYYGDLRKQDCENCGPRLRVEIRNREAGRADTNGIESSLGPGTYAWQAPPVRQQRTIYRVEFKAQPASSHPISAYSWTLGERKLSELAAFRYDFNSPTPVSVTLRLANTAGLSSESNLQIAPGGEPCPFDIAVGSLNSEGLIGLKIIPADNREPAGVFWGNGIIGPSIEVLPSGAYCARVFTVDSCASARCIQFTSGRNGAYCAANFSYRTTRIDSTQLVEAPVASPISVTLRYTDAQGREFRSDLSEQSPASRFEILRSEPFQRNEKGQATRQLFLRFTCRLTSANGQVIAFSNAEGAIAVAHP